jgi:MFS transporter, SP family, sugar:H+ symporter
MAITLGILLAACVNYGTKDYRHTGAYRVPIALQLLWALILGFGLLFMPESPRWYIMWNKPVPARTSLAKFRDQDQNSAFVEVEFQELQRSWTEESKDKENGNGSGWLDCFRGSNLHRTFIGTAIQMMQQLSKSSDCPSMVTLDSPFDSWSELHLLLRHYFFRDYWNR